MAAGRLLAEHYAILFLVMGFVTRMDAQIVNTESEIVLRKGSPGVLPCRANTDVAGVYWSKGPTFRTSTILLYIEFHEQTRTKIILRDYKGLYDINDNHSLVINSARIQDNDNFYCEILNRDSDTFSNQTNVIVFAVPIEPYPVIQDCFISEQTGDENCSIYISSVNISCSIHGYFPSVVLYFQHNGSKLVNNIHVRQNNTDLTKNKTIVVTAEPSTLPYSCVASQIPGYQNIEKEAFIYVNELPLQSTKDTPAMATLSTKSSSSGNTKTNAISIVVPVVIFTILIVAIGLVVLWKWRRKHEHDPESRAEGNHDVELNTPLMKDAPLTEDDIRPFKDALKTFYCDVFGEIKTSPLDPDSGRKLEDMYVNLSLLKADGSEKSVVIAYEEIFTILLGRDNVTRVAFFGEAGVGKTTLLAKIAYDWATGKYLQTIELLIFVPLRLVQHTTYLADIPKSYINREITIDSKRVDMYVKANQNKVVFLLDGLDEFGGDLIIDNPTDPLVRIITKADLISTPIIVTTRPWKAKLITSSQTINKQYTRAIVQGFKEDDVKHYIEKFFAEDKESANSLVHLVTNDSLVAENMAPYPIFCSMLCHTWKEESRRTTITKMQTFSQLIEEMTLSLLDQWVSKDPFRNYRKRAMERLKQIGRVAFDGLIVQKLTFSEETFKDCYESLRTGCDIGVLSTEKRFNSKQMSVSFPHKLFQEYLAGLYLATLSSDRPDTYNSHLKNKVLPRYDEFRYLLYFTASNGKQTENGGRELIELLCSEIADDKFIIDVAFESHDEDAITPVFDFLQHKTSLVLQYDVQQDAKHTWSGYMYTLAVWADRMGNADKSQATRKGRYDKSSNASAFGLFTLPLLRSLELKWVYINDSFLTGMVSAASNSQIEKLTLEYLELGPEASEQCARGIFAMKNLQSLVLRDVKLDYKVLSDLAPTSKISNLTIEGKFYRVSLSEECARGIFNMSNLISLHLHRIGLDDEFFTVMSELAPKIKIENLVLDYLDFNHKTAKQCAEGITVMSRLRDLELRDIKLDVFFEVFSELPSTTQVKTLTIRRNNLTSQIAVSSKYARAIFKMGNLRSLHLHNLDCQDDFFSTMLETAPASKIEELNFRNVSIGPTTSDNFARGLFVMKDLKTVRLYRVGLRSEFFSVMAELMDSSQIEKLVFSKLSLGEAASERFARGAFGLKRLRSLELDGVKLHRRFIAVMAQLASSCQMKKLTLKDTTFSPKDSLLPARGIFTLPNLRSLKLDNIELDDDFFPVMVKLAPNAQIHTLYISSIPMCQNVFRTILTLPHLQTLTLHDITYQESTGVEYGSWSDLNESLTEVTNGNVLELHVDDTSLPGICELELHTACPQVQKLGLSYSQEVGSESIKMGCSPFSQLSELQVKGYDPWPSIKDMDTFCRDIVSSCSGIAKLEVNGVKLGNRNALKLMKGMTDHKTLSGITITNCDTNEDLDVPIAKLIEGSRFCVTLEHGQPNSSADS